MMKDCPRGDAAADRRPALRPFSSLFEIVLLETGGVRGRKGDPLQTDPLQKQAARSPQASNWPSRLETTSVRAALALHARRQGRASFDRTWPALVLTCQVFVGAFLSIAAQFVLAVAVIFYLLASMGLELLDTARAVAEFDLPMRVLGLLWGNH
jgi:hypothetical protein